MQLTPGGCPRTVFWKDSRDHQAGEVGGRLTDSGSGRVWRILVARATKIRHGLRASGQAALSAVRHQWLLGRRELAPTAPDGPRAVQPEPASHLVVAVATAPKSTAKARHTSGSLMTNAEREGVIRCGGYRFKGPTTFQFKLQPVSTTRATFTIGFTYEIAERITNTTADGVQFCLGANFRFKTLSGRPAPARRLPDGTRGHVGLLPPCPQPLPPPGLTSAACLGPSRQSRT